MPLHLAHFKRVSRPRRNLRARGDILHTFGTLLATLAMGLVAAGFYLLGSAFLHPVTADSALLLVAALMLSLGFVVLSYLLRSAVATQPSRRPPRPHRAVSENFSSRAPQPASVTETASEKKAAL